MNQNSRQKIQSAKPQSQENGKLNLSLDSKINQNSIKKVKIIKIKKEKSELYNDYYVSNTEFSEIKEHFKLHKQLQQMNVKLKLLMDQSLNRKEVTQTFTSNKQILEKQIYNNVSKIGQLQTDLNSLLNTKDRISQVSHLDEVMEKIYQIKHKISEEKKFNHQLEVESKKIETLIKSFTNSGEDLEKNAFQSLKADINVQNLRSNNQNTRFKEIGWIQEDCSKRLDIIEQRLNKAIELARFYHVEDEDIGRYNYQLQLKEEILKKEKRNKFLYNSKSKLNEKLCSQIAIQKEDIRCQQELEQEFISEMSKLSQLYSQEIEKLKLIAIENQNIIYENPEIAQLLTWQKKQTQILEFFQKTNIEISLPLPKQKLEKTEQVLQQFDCLKSLDFSIQKQKIIEKNEELPQQDTELKLNYNKIFEKETPKNELDKLYSKPFHQRRNSAMTFLESHSFIDHNLLQNIQNEQQQITKEQAIDKQPIIKKIGEQENFKTQIISQDNAAQQQQLNNIINNEQQQIQQQQQIIDKEQQILLENNEPQQKNISNLQSISKEIDKKINSNKSIEDKQQTFYNFEYHEQIDNKKEVMLNLNEKKKIKLNKDANKNIIEQNAQNPQDQVSIAFQQKEEIKLINLNEKRKQKKMHQMQQGRIFKKDDEISWINNQQKFSQQNNSANSLETISLNQK